MKRHNTHMLLPEELWKKMRDIAIREGSNITDLVIEGLKLLLEKRRDDK